MGVKGLWELLSPVGRRIHIETLEGKILAIDASIWITQFIKAMRDDEGKVLKNAHILGTLRRILKLLHNRIRPVFVFDGATPGLKIQTVRARRLLREKQEINVKKTAERLLLEKIKRHMMAKSSKKSDISTSSEMTNFAPGFHPPNFEEDSRSSIETSRPIPEAEAGDENDEDEWEEGYSHLVAKDLNQPESNSSTSRRRVSSSSLNRGSDDDVEAEGDWVLPEKTEEIDSSTLASLPSALRKHVIEEARKKQSRVNRSHYLPVAGDPLLYSKTQLANFLRTSKFNQVIAKTQEESDRMEREKNGSGGHIISSDGNRRYILQKGIRDTDIHDNEESQGEDMSWLNDSDEDEIQDSKLSEHKRPPNEHRIDPPRKRTKFIVDDSDEGSECGGFIKQSEIEEFQNPVEEGGFIVESPKPQHQTSPTKPEKDLVDNTKIIETERNQWVCESCTFLNDFNESYCAMCKNSPFDSKKQNDPNSDFLHNRNDAEALPDSKDIISIDSSNPTVPLQVDSIQSDTDDWEDNDYSEPAVPIETPQINLPIFEPPAKSIPIIDENIISRAVSSASSMGDWAGRAVRKVLQGTSQGITKISPEKSPIERSPLKEMSTSQLIDNCSQNNSPVLGTSSANMNDNFGDGDSDTGNGYEVDELEFERRAMRDAEVLTSGMVADIKSLLDAFEIPYISAPYEAEAQCAFLEMAGIVDGIVTEDSDVFLFGGKCIYKNIFDEKKYVEAYLAEDLRRDLGVDRSDLVSLAFLLGSDYTDGVKGIGIVNAMEIIDVFGSQTKELLKQSSVNNVQNEGGFLELMQEEMEKSSKTTDVQEDIEKSLGQLKDFKEWLLAPYDFKSLKFFQGKKKETQKTKRKKKNSVPEDEMEGFEETENTSGDLRQQKLIYKEEFSTKHAGLRKKWTLKESFPDPIIAEAYFSPKVNKLTDKFCWETPKLFRIKKYVSTVLGWTEEEVIADLTEFLSDSQIASKITPVIQKCIAEKGTATQSRIDSYYLTHYDDDKRFARIQSDRLKGAVTRVKGRQKKK